MPRIRRGYGRWIATGNHSTSTLAIRKPTPTLLFEMKEDELLVG